MVHLDYVLSCRVIAEERRRVLARELHEQGLERDTALARLEADRAAFRTQASALHARLVSARLFDRGELADLRGELIELVATIDAAATASLRVGRDGADLAPVRR